MLRAWIRRMCARPSLSGSENSTRRSRRPGRRRAGSRVSGLANETYQLQSSQPKQKTDEPVGGHQYFDVSSWVETVQLIDQLQHRSLHFIITSSSIIESRSTNGINLIEENDTRLLTPRHLEQLTDHTRTLTDILLDELGTNDTDEGSVCAVGYSTGTEGLAGTWGPEKENTLGRVNTEVDETFWL